MRKEAEIILNQCSEVASKILETSNYSEIEQLILIYINFFDQVSDILKEHYYNDIALRLEYLNNNVQKHLSELKIKIKQEIHKENIKNDVSNKFNFKILDSIIDKKV